MSESFVRDVERRPIIKCSVLSAECGVRVGACNASSRTHNDAHSIFRERLALSSISFFKLATDELFFFVSIVEERETYYLLCCRGLSM